MGNTGWTCKVRLWIGIVAAWIASVSVFALLVIGLDTLSLRDPAFEGDSFPPLWLQMLIGLASLALYGVAWVLKNRTRRFRRSLLIGLGSGFWWWVAYQILATYVPYWGNTWQNLEVLALLILDPVSYACGGSFVLLYVWLVELNWRMR